jgi:hypothetical protein
MAVGPQQGSTFDVINSHWQHRAIFNGPEAAQENKKLDQPRNSAKRGIKTKNKKNEWLEPWGGGYPWEPGGGALPPLRVVHSHRPPPPQGGSCLFFSLIFFFFLNKIIKK